MPVLDSAFEDLVEPKSVEPLLAFWCARVDRVDSNGGEATEKLYCTVEIWMIENFEL